MAVFGFVFMMRSTGVRRVCVGCVLGWSDVVVLVWCVVFVELGVTGVEARAGDF